MPDARNSAKSIRDASVSRIDRPPAVIQALLKTRWLSAAARLLLTLPFWWSAIAKLIDFPSALAEARHFGLEPAVVVAIVTIAVQLGGSILLIAGRWTWLAAGALAGFTVLATLVGHDFWTVADPLLRFQQRNIFFEHMAIVGGFVLAAILADREQAA